MRGELPWQSRRKCRAYRADQRAFAASGWQQAMTEYEEPAMVLAIREELEAYFARRREEIGNDEP